MKRMMAILSMLLVLVACAPGQTTQTGGIPEGTATTTVSGDKSVLEQVKAETEAKNDKYQQFVVPGNIKKGEAGDLVVFGSMFN